MQVINKFTLTRRSLLQSIAGMASSPYLSTEVLAVPTPAQPLLITRPTWHRIPTVIDGQRGFIVGNLSSETLKIPRIDVSPTVLANAAAVFFAPPVGSTTPSDIAATLLQQGTTNAVLLDIGGSAVQCLTDVQTALDQQYACGVDFEDFRHVVSSNTSAIRTLCVGTGTARGHDAGNTALDIAIMIAGFGRSNRLADVRGMFVAIAANSATLRLPAVRDLHRSLRKKVNRDCFTVKGLVLDNHQADGEWRVSVMVPV